MNSDNDYPGTLRHQALQTAIVSFYSDDPRILAISIFGSLSRGTWDHYSDIDLDIVIADNIHIDVVEELKRLCDSLTTIAEHGAVIVPDGNDAGDIVFESLMQLSIRYHPLMTTNPKIVNSLRTLAGKLDQATIVAAGLANQKTINKSFQTLLDSCVRYVTVTDVALQRQHNWEAVEGLQRIRGLLMELYTLAYGGRSPHTFQAKADPELQSRLGCVLPQYSLVSLQRSLLQCLEMLEWDLVQLTQGQVQLTETHRKVLAHVRARQAQHINGG